MLPTILSENFFGSLTAMHPSFLLFIIIMLMLLCERVLAIRLTLHPRSRAFIQRCILLHPNTISLMRIPMGLVSTILVHFGYWQIGMLWFAFWMITDLTDGTIARNCQLETETGKWLDPLSDKCMYFPCLLYFSIGPNINPDLRLELWSVLLFITIDSLGQASRLFSQKKAANYFGKGKTALVTILLSSLAFYNMQPLPFLNSSTVNYIMASCNLLAFLSFYLKVIPDQWYANTLTFANFACGLSAIVIVCKYNWFTSAFVLIFIGQFFDLFDGRLARKFGSTKYGAIFDDIADATSFGFAAACIIYKGLAFHEKVIAPWLAMLLALFYVVCLLYRLYRFLYPSKPQTKGVFQGMPSPAGALLVCSAVLAGMRFDHPISGIITATVVVVSSCLMVSNIPYLHFGQSLWPSLPRSVKLLLLVVPVVFVNIVLVKKHDWETTFIWLCLALGLTYAIFAVQGKNKIPQPQNDDRLPGDKDKKIRNNKCQEST